MSTKAFQYFRNQSAEAYQSNEPKLDFPKFTVTQYIRNNELELKIDGFLLLS